MRYHHFAALLIIALCALLVQPVQAQSGRRRTTPPPAAPVPTPTPEPTPTPKKSDKDDELLFFLGADRYSSNVNLPFSFYDAVLRGCAERLRAGSSASIDVSNKDFTRGEAIKRAKSETKSYVVYMELEVDNVGRSSDDLVLEYIVFAPVTAKMVTNGRNYMRGRRAGPVVVGPPTSRTGGLYREELLRRMGEEAGDRIIKALHLNVPLPK
ncbi:MAG TPA: hypothetical protein VJ751_06205 [Pyrinomonadaceae bacterium]|nr:hypothetical protein [Pyrinomonadaceae bacterium]